MMRARMKRSQHHTLTSIASSRIQRVMTEWSYFFAALIAFTIISLLNLWIWG